MESLGYPREHKATQHAAAAAAAGVIVGGVSGVLIAGDVLAKPVEIIAVAGGWVLMHGWLRGFVVLAKGGTKQQVTEEVSFASAVMSPSGVMVGIAATIYVYSS